MTKVLVAEDNPVNRELLRELLENRGRYWRLYRDWAEQAAA